MLLTMTEDNTIAPEDYAPADVCPATGGPHAFEQDGDDFQTWVSCVECGASPERQEP